MNYFENLDLFVWLCFVHDSVPLLKIYLSLARSSMNKETRYLWQDDQICCRENPRVSN